MANLKSAKKRIKVAARNQKKNLWYKNKIKKLIKQARQAVEKGQENAAALISQTISWLDKAASKNVIKKNKASRQKSRLMRSRAASKPR